MHDVAGPSLITAGRIAAGLRQPLHRVSRVLETRHFIKPAAFAGRTRLYSSAAIAQVRHELDAIEELLQAAVDEADAEPATSLWSPAVTMASIDRATTTWLWDGHIPTGAISNLSGDPGLGKSQLTCDLGARISRGWNKSN